MICENCWVGPGTINENGVKHLKKVAKRNKKINGKRLSANQEITAKLHGFNNWTHAVYLANKTELNQ